MDGNPGPLLALATTLCWTISSLSFTDATRRIGSLSVNIIRLFLAGVFLAAYGLYDRGLPLPTDAPGSAWLWLSASGFIGFFLGDLCLFKAFLLLGARLTMLLMSLAPPIAAGLGILVLGERLGPLNWIGMAVTLLGVSWVVLERGTDESGAPRRVSWGGILLGIGAAAGQAIGAVLSKVGMGAENYDAFASTQIRVLAGLAGFGVLLLFLGWYPKVLGALRQPRAMLSTSAGAFLGPFLGVSLFLKSIHTIPIGVAQTIVSLVPVVILPFVIVLHRERISLRAAVGALVAVAGVALLLLTPEQLKGFFF